MTGQLIPIGGAAMIAGLVALVGGAGKGIGVRALGAGVMLAGLALAGLAVRRLRR